jgi:hypothetical protein
MTVSRLYTSLPQHAVSDIDSEGLTITLSGVGSQVDIFPRFDLDVGPESDIARIEHEALHSVAQHLASFDFIRGIAKKLAFC